MVKGKVLRLYEKNAVFESLGNIYYFIIYINNNNNNIYIKFNFYIIIRYWIMSCCITIKRRWCKRFKSM